MKNIYLFVLIVLSVNLISCKKINIKNIETKYLSNEEINKLPETQTRINTLSQNQYDTQFSRANDIHIEQWRIKNKVSKLAVAVNSFKHGITRDAFNKVYPNLLNVLKTKNQQIVYKENKYAFKYSFEYVNNYKEPLDTNEFDISIQYIFPNKKIIFNEKFSKNEIIESNKSLHISRTLVFNYLPNYDKAYFEVYKPEKIFIIVKAKSENKVGFINLIEKKQEITN